MISAIAKAEKLYEFAKSQGAKQDTFELTLSEDEAFELLDWFLAQYGDNTQLADDVALAKLDKNPWDVLSNFTLLGLKMAPIPVLN